MKRTPNCSTKDLPELFHACSLSPACTLLSQQMKAKPYTILNQPSPAQCPHLWLHYLDTTQLMAVDCEEDEDMC